MQPSLCIARLRGSQGLGGRRSILSCRAGVSTARSVALGTTLLHRTVMQLGEEGHAMLQCS